MGSAVHTLTRSQHLIMKFVLALLFVGLAFAEPEGEATGDAAADAYYGYYGYPGYYGHRWGGYRGYYGHGYGYGYYGRKKRDAEAHPAVLATTSAVKAPQVYTHPYAYGYPYAHYGPPAQLTYTHAVTTTPVTYTVPKALTYAHHYPYTYGYGHLPYLIKPVEGDARKKREADGEPEADPEAWYGHYYGYGGYGHRYYGGYGGYGRYYGYPGYGYGGYYYGK